MASALALAKVIVIAKDEYDLIGDFLRFYGELFGRENVVVVDNGSRADDERVQAEYRAHVAAGGEVRVDVRPFADAARFMGEHMRGLRGRCEFILPLETDEFIFMLDRAADAGYATARADVEAALRAIPADVSVVRYGAFYGSAVDPADAGYERGAYTRPARQLTRFYDQGWDKIIVRASRFEGMTQWCHHAAVSGGRKETSAALGLLHFHDAGLRRVVEKSVPVVEAYGYLRGAETLDEQLRALAPLMGAPIACGHKLNYLGRHLRRTAALRAFRGRLGRLPDSAEELDRYANADAGACDVPDEAVRRAILAGELRQEPARSASYEPPGPSWEELLYHERRMDGDIRVHHVANVFKGPAERAVERAVAGRGGGSSSSSLLGDIWDATRTRTLVVGAACAADAAALDADADALDAPGCVRAARAAAGTAVVDWIDARAAPAAPAVPAEAAQLCRRCRRLDPDASDALRMLDTSGYDVVVDARPTCSHDERLRTARTLMPLLLEGKGGALQKYVVLGAKAARSEMELLATAVHELPGVKACQLIGAMLVADVQDML